MVNLKRITAWLSVALMMVSCFNILPYTQEVAVHSAVSQESTHPSAPADETTTTVVASTTSHTPATTTQITAPVTVTTTATVVKDFVSVMTATTGSVAAASVSTTAVAVSTTTETLSEPTSLPVTVSRTFETTEAVSATVEMTLDAEKAPSLTLAPSTQAPLFPDTMPGLLGAACEVSVDGAFDSAKLSFTWDADTQVVEPTVYYFSEETQELIPAPTVVNGQTAVATVDEAATYVLLDRAVYSAALTWEDTWGVTDVYTGTEVVLVIDDSSTMAATDPSAKRLEAARDLIDRLPQNSRIGAVRFSNVIDVLTPSLTADRAAVSAMLTTDTFVSRGGTLMYTAVEEALTLFENDSPFTQRVMIVLTDGWAVDTFAYDTIVDTINANDIHVYTVGLDGSDDCDIPALKAFTNDANGTFYYADEADMLHIVYECIARLVDLTTDTDGDTIPDYYEEHMLAFNGVKIPLDKTLADTDGDGIPDNEEVSVSLVYSEDGSQVYIKGSLLSDPTLCDGDGDGILDEADAAPFDNGFHTTITTEFATSSMLFTMDYPAFFADNTVYSKELSQVSSLLSALAYEPSSLRLVDTPNVQGIETASVAELLGFFGMQHPQNFKLNEQYTDNHVSEVTVGYRNVVVDSELKTVLAVVIRGTNGTIAEWSSNCDIGNLLADTADDDWVNTLNHKGFDVTATRIRRFVEEYIVNQGLCADTVAYWVTGHSRGAAIANILGANLEREGKEAFTYTFAAPNTTLATDASVYRTIFNILNEDDFVPCMPMEKWGYTRYGVSASISVANTYESAWENFTGIFDYNPAGDNMATHVNTMAGIIKEGADPRIDAYKYTCACHGDGSNTTVTATNGGMSESSRDKAIAKIPANALPYCIITKYTGGFLSGWDFDVCQTPAYFMQLLAAFMGGEIDAYRFAVELNYAERYADAKGALVSLGISGVEHPHYPETYIFLAERVTMSDFT